MKLNFRRQLRLSHFLLVAPIAAAFLCGRYFPAAVSPATVTPGSIPVVSVEPVPLAFDFAFPVETQTKDSSKLAFYVGVTR